MSYRSFFYIVFFVHFFLNDIMLLASSKTEIIILFKPNSTEIEKNLIHKKMGSTLLYRSNRLHIDTIETNMPKNLIISNLCPQYKKNDIIRECILPSPIKLNPYYYYNDLFKIVGNYSRSDDDIRCTLNFNLDAIQLFTESIYEILENLNCDIFDNNHNYFIQKNDNNSLKEPTSLFWAQDMIGADLAKDEMEKLFQLGKVNSKKAVVGIVDVGFFTDENNKLYLKNQIPQNNNTSKSHAHQVANLVVGNQDTSSSWEPSYIVREFSPTSMLQLVDQVKRSDKLTCINFSCTLNNEINSKSSSSEVSNYKNEENLFIQYLNELTNNRITQIHAIGNDYPDPVDNILSSINSINVGSINSRGLPSDFSQSDEKLTTIWAPGDAVATRDVNFKNNQLKKVSGTSFAAPLVTGSVYNLKRILPGITDDEIKMMLRKTSTPNNGLPYAGILNELRLIRSAERLISKWPNNRDDILDHTLYDFSKEAEMATQEGLGNLKSKNCSTIKKGFKLLRTAFLLDPSNELARKTLSEIYQKNGFTNEAQFYKGSALKENIQSIADTKTRILQIARSKNELGETFSNTFKDSFNEFCKNSLNSEQGVLIYLKLFQILGPDFWKRYNLPDSNFMDNHAQIALQSILQLSVNDDEKKIFFNTYACLFSSYIKTNMESKNRNNQNIFSNLNKKDYSSLLYLSKRNREESCL